MAIEDVREGRLLRVSLHTEFGLVVISHWKGDECIATTRVPVAAVGELIELLQEGLPTWADESVFPMDVEAT